MSHFIIVIIYQFCMSWSFYLIISWFRTLGLLVLLWGFFRMRSNFQSLFRCFTRNEIIYLYQCLISSLILSLSFLFLNHILQYLIYSEIIYTGSFLKKSQSMANSEFVHIWYINIFSRMCRIKVFISRCWFWPSSRWWCSCAVIWNRIFN